MTVKFYRVLLVQGVSEEKQDHRDFQGWRGLQDQKEWQAMRVLRGIKGQRDLQGCLVGIKLWETSRPFCCQLNLGECHLSYIWLIVSFRANLSKILEEMEEISMRLDYYQRLSHHSPPTG